MKPAALCCLGMLAIGSMLGHAVQASDTSAKVGKALYERHCLACHGAGGRGDGPTGKVLIPPAADLAAATQKKTEAQLMATVEKGKPGTAMPPFKHQLSQDDMRAVLAYIRTLTK